jgi:hypothetical protein
MASEAETVGHELGDLPPGEKSDDAGGGSGESSATGDAAAAAGEPLQKKEKKKPRRVLHFSDGVLEEYSTDEEGELSNVAVSRAKNMAVADPVSIGIGSQDSRS